MAYLYHLLPQHMAGHTLYPLNRLKSLHPAIFRKEVRKYAGREFIMQQRIAPLNCFWNDVLHLTGVHPCRLAKALAVAQFSRDLVFFEIDIAKLDRKRTIVYLNKHRSTEKKLSKRNFRVFKVRDLPLYATIPRATIRYYIRMAKKRTQPLLFHAIPHILYKGSLPVKDARKISVRGEQA